MVREFQRERPSVEAVYVVHEDRHNDAHIAATGAKRELTMYADDLERFEERAAEQFREPQRLRQRERHRKARRELERTRDRHRELHREAQLPFAGGQRRRPGPGTGAGIKSAARTLIMHNISRIRHRPITGGDKFRPILMTTTTQVVIHSLGLMLEDISYPVSSFRVTTKTASSSFCH